jgi:hypothetical protein
MGDIVKLPEADVSWGITWKRTIVTLAAVWALVGLGCAVRSYFSLRTHNVYFNYHEAGLAWRAGADPYALPRDAQGKALPHMAGFRYSPLVATLFVPFSLVSENVAGMVWRWLSLAALLGAFAWCGVAVFQVSPSQGSQPWRVGVLWLALLPLSLPSINNGQANVAMVACVLAASAAVVGQRWNLAAWFMAGAVLLKLYPLAFALLLVVAFPRQLSWRFGLAMLAGLALPFLLQSPDYVLSTYQNWWDLLLVDNRHDIPPLVANKDCNCLLRFFGLELSQRAYFLVQAGTGALVALLGLWGQRRGWDRRQVVAALLCMGCAWMVAFGPATETSTYIVLAPVLAWSMVDACQIGRPLWSRAALGGVVSLFLLRSMSGWVPGAGNWAFILHPLAALAFFSERWVFFALATTTHEKSSGAAAPLARAA